MGHENIMSGSAGRQIALWREMELCHKRKPLKCPLQEGENPNDIYLAQTDH